jgi:hypothetical protein
MWVRNPVGEGKKSIRHVSLDGRSYEQAHALSRLDRHELR